MLIYLCLLLALVNFRCKSKSVLCQGRLVLLHSGQSSHTVPERDGREINLYQKGMGTLGRTGLIQSGSAPTAVAARDHWHSETTLHAQTARKIKCAGEDARSSLQSYLPLGEQLGTELQNAFSRQSSSIQMRVLLCQPGLGMILELFLQNGQNACKLNE